MDLLKSLEILLKKQKAKPVKGESFSILDSCDLRDEIKNISSVLQLSRTKNK